MAGIHIDITADNVDLKKKLEESREAIKEYTEETVKDGAIAQAVMDKEYAKIAESKKYYDTKRDAAVNGSNAEAQAMQSVSKKVNELSLTYKERAKILIDESGDIENALKMEQSIIAQMETDYKALNVQVQQMGRGAAKTEALKELKQAKKDIEDEKVLLSQLNTELKHQGETEAVLRTQIINKKQELLKLTFGTQEYIKVAKELGVLQTKMAVANAQGKIYSNPYKNLTLAKESIQGLTGALTVATSVSTMFGTSQENIAKIQMKLQQVMAITMGIQQMSVLLNKTSYVRTLLLVKAKNLLSVAELKLATSMNISAVAARGLLAALSGGLSLVVIGIISAFNALSKKNSDLSKSFEEMQSTFSESFGKTSYVYEKLSNQYNKLGDTLKDKEKFIRENQKAFNDLSLSVKSTSDADYLFVNGSHEVIKALKERSMAMAYAKQIQSKFEANAKLEFENEKLDEFIKQNAGSSMADEMKRKAALEKIAENTGDILKNNQDISTMQKLEEKSITDSTKILSNGSTDTTIALGDLVKQLKVETAKTKQAIADANSGKISQEELQAQQKKLSDLKSMYQSRIGKSWGESIKKNDKKETADYSLDYESKTKALADASYQRGLQMREAEINGMKEGLDKLLAQSDFDYNKQKHQIEEQEKELKEKLNESYKVLWQQKGNEGKDFSMDKYKAKYPEEVQEYNDKIIAIEKDTNKYKEQITANFNAKTTKINKDYLSGLFDEYKGYFDKRKDIQEKYDKKLAEINQYAPEDKKDALIKELDYQTEQSNKALDVEFAQREQSYKNWLSTISNLSIKSLETMLVEAKQQLAKLKNEGSVDEKAFAVTSAKIQALEDELEKAKLSPKERTYKEWKDLSDVLGSVAGKFSEIGDAVGGTQGEILKSASVIATTALGMINNIQQLAVISQNATTATANTASKAIQAVEKASVILAIISAAIQLMQQLEKILPTSFNQYEKYAAEIKEINKLTQAVDAYDIALQKSKAARENWFGADALKSLKDYKALQDKVFKAYTDKATESQAVYQNESGGGWLTNTINNLMTWASPLGWIDSDLWKNIWGTKSYEKGQTAAMNNLRIETKKKSSGFLGSGIGGHSQKTADLQTWINQQKGWENEKLFDEMGFINKDLAQTILDKYGDKLVGESKETIEALVDLKSQYDEYLDQLHDYVSQMYEPLVQNFTDSLWDWFDSGKNALDSFKEYASDTFRDIVTDMMKTIVLDKVVGSFQNDITKLYEKYSMGAMSEQDLMQSVASLTNDLMERYQTQLPALQELMKTMQDQIKQTTGIDIDSEANRTASQKGIAQASQDTVDELNGRITVIQSHTYEINATTKALLQNSNITLSHLANIETNTAKLISIETDIHSVKSTLEDINVRGILLR